MDVTCWRRDAGRLLIALAASAAEQIRQGLLTHSNTRELALFQAYRQACRRTTGIVIAFSDSVTMMNDAARHLLDQADQSAVLAHGAQALAEGSAAATITLPTGTMAQIRCREVPGHRVNEPAGGVLSVTMLELGEPLPSDSMTRPSSALPGVTGSSAIWARCCAATDAGYRRGEWLILAGEPGTGKHTILRGVHQRHRPTGRMHVLDAAEPGADWPADLRRELRDDPPDTLVIRHVDRLDEAARDVLTGALRTALATRTPAWVALTTVAVFDARGAELSALFPRTVQVPPLRSHLDDLTELVPLLLGRLSRNADLTRSVAALHLLMRAGWPGNVAQLRGVLTQVTRHRRAGTIEPTDLPPESRGIRSTGSSPRSATPSCRAWRRRTATRRRRPRSSASPGPLSTGRSTSTESSRPPRDAGR